MARQLWLLRHADAEPHGTREDSERRLTQRGEGQARTAGAALACMGVDFDAILFSPKVRARQTAELACEQMGEDALARLSVHPPLAGGFNAGAAIDAMAGVTADGRLLLVGHEPDLSGVVGGLTGGRVEMKKGGLAVVRLQGGSGELAVLLRPVELALIAGGVGGVPIHGD
jgi:phosphohistidine phosphatase